MNGISTFCARSWASRVLADPVLWAPPPSLCCVIFVSGPISGLYFLRSASVICSIRIVRIPVSVKKLKGRLASMSALEKSRHCGSGVVTSSAWCPSTRRIRPSMLSVITTT